MYSLGTQGISTKGCSPEPLSDSPRSHLAALVTSRSPRSLLKEVKKEGRAFSQAPPPLNMGHFPIKSMKMAGVTSLRSTTHVWEKDQVHV
jgi:hypothetical protein